ncbi:MULTISPECIES: ABC transporter permease [Sinorhizobium]|uniref:ABC transporter permease n=1 Tax=Sinorhizobium TaxID=28105 RepID=UPI000BE97CAB|nr:MULTISPECIES: ABC transporter permease [Sinorhizobium]PDT50882.1 ABC transporter permease [Sinorhizobium sp. NG07B]
MSTKMISTNTGTGLNKPRTFRDRIPAWFDNSTLSWLGGRLLTSVVAVAVVMTAVFLVTRLISDPARRMLPLGASQEQIDALNATLGLSDPLYVQYIHFLGDLATLNLGESIWYHLPSLEVALGRLPSTLSLLAIALAISIVVFVPMGILASTRPGSLVDRLVTGVSLAGLSVPQFWLGAMLVLVFSVGLGWFPTSGAGSLSHAILPAVTLSLSLGGRLAQVTRTSFLDQGKMPYVTMARAKGFSSLYVLRKHVLRNALLPILTIISWDSARMITGHAVIVEVLFARPGFGRLVIESVKRQDFTQLQACVFVGAVVIVIVNILTDILARIVEPRRASK